MKRISCILLISFSLLLFVACKNNETSNAASVDKQVCYELQQIENIDTFSEETIKAMSVVIRTNLENEKNTKNVNFENFNDKLYKIVKSTSNKKLKQKSTNKKLILKNNSDKTWQRKINKTDILSYMLSKGINLANISSIETKYNNQNKLESITVAEKEILYSELKEIFNLPTDIVTDVKIEQSYIIILGEYNEEDLNIFNLEKAEELSKKGLNYEKIIKKTINNYEKIIN